MCQEGRGQTDRHLGSSTSSHGEGAMFMELPWSQDPSCHSRQEEVAAQCHHRL